MLLAYAERRWEDVAELAQPANIRPFPNEPAAEVLVEVVAVLEVLRGREVRGLDEAPLVRGRGDVVTRSFRRQRVLYDSVGKTSHVLNETAEFIWNPPRCDEVHR